MTGMPRWTSLEVLDGAFTASMWSEAWSDALAEAALSHGALDWKWQAHGCSVVLEVAFADAAGWERFHSCEAMRAALDAAPDPTAVFVYFGRGATSGPTVPRRPRPMAGSGAAALSLPLELTVEDAPRLRLTLTR